MDVFGTPSKGCHPPKKEGGVGAGQMPFCTTILDVNIAGLMQLK